MRLLVALSTLTCVLAAAAYAWGIPALPRKSPEFTITEPVPANAPDRVTLLSKYRGKVVLLAFVSTTCPHCQAYSQQLTKLHKELGSQGFQPIAVAFNPQAKMLVPGFVAQNHVDFPVAYSESYDSVMSFMGFSVMDRPVVPLAVVIDRKGMIRAQSPPEGDANLQDENYLRTFLTKLLNEHLSAQK